jgi:hypothetical protein
MRTDFVDRLNQRGTPASNKESRKGSEYPPKRGANLPSPKVVEIGSHGLRNSIKSIIDALDRAAISPDIEDAAAANMTEIVTPEPQPAHTSK